MFLVHSLQGQGSGGKGLLEPGGNPPFPLAPDLLFSCYELSYRGVSSISPSLGLSR